MSSENYEESGYSLDSDLGAPHTDGCRTFIVEVLWFSQHVLKQSIFSKAEWT